jgi:hypothetical protein
MARKTTFTYICDSCGADMERQKDLQRFVVALVGSGMRQTSNAHADFCAECEARFLATVEPFFPAESLPKLHAMSREEE